MSAAAAHVWVLESFFADFFPVSRVEPTIDVSPPLCAIFSMRMRSKFCCASSSAFTFWYRCSSLHKQKKNITTTTTIIISAKERDERKNTR